MPLSDAATVALALATPVVAGAVALVINERRMRQERALARRDEIRELLLEGSEALRGILLELPRGKEPPATQWEPNHEAVRAMARMLDRLPLWFERTHPVRAHWREIYDAVKGLNDWNAESDDDKQSQWRAGVRDFLNAAQLWNDAARKYLDVH